MYEDIMFQTKDHLVFHWFFFLIERGYYMAASSVEKYFTSEQKKK